MKKLLAFSLVFTSISQCQIINIASNSFGVVFEDATLSATNKLIIAGDVSRLLMPSKNTAVYRAYNAPDVKGFVGALGRLSASAGHPKNGLPQYVKQNATNGLDIVVSQALSDEYLTIIDFMQDKVVEQTQADVFAHGIITNGFANLSLTDINALFLFKEWAPNAIPQADALLIAANHAQNEYFLPSLFGYHMENEGPNNATYLWGMLPTSKSGLGIPIIYYQNQWRISWWFMETGEQQW